jgi:hypothetical protein
MQIGNGLLRDKEGEEKERERERKMGRPRKKT